MMQKYDEMQRRRVVFAFANSFGRTDQNGRYYSLTARKKGIAEGEGLRLSDVDRILYGRELAVEGISLEQEREAVQLYNTRRDLSVKKLAEELSGRFGTKVNKDRLYKMLYEMDSRENNVVWRGSPKALANYHAKESKLEESVEPAAIKVEKVREKGFWSYFTPRNIAASIAAGVIVGLLGVYSAKADVSNYLSNSRIIELIRGRETKQVSLEETRPGQVIVIRGNEVSQEHYGLKSIESKGAKILDVQKEVAARKIGKKRGFVEVIRGNQVSIEEVGKGLVSKI